jgi:hypothetical protein
MLDRDAMIKQRVANGHARLDLERSAFGAEVRVRKNGNRGHVFIALQGG